MTQFVVGTDAELRALEAQCWVVWVRAIVTELWGGEIKDVTTGEKHKIDTLTDDDLDDRTRFPLFGYVNGVLNTANGYTRRWSEPQEVTKAGSPYLGKFFMPLPAPISQRWEQVLALYSSVAAHFPGIETVEAGIYDLVEPSPDIDGEGG